MDSNESLKPSRKPCHQEPPPVTEHINSGAEQSSPKVGRGAAISQQYVEERRRTRKAPVKRVTRRRGGKFVVDPQPGTSTEGITTRQLRSYARQAKAAAPDSKPSGTHSTSTGAPDSDSLAVNVSDTAGSSITETTSEHTEVVQDPAPLDTSHHGSESGSDNSFVCKSCIVCLIATLHQFNLLIFFFSWT